MVVFDYKAAVDELLEAFDSIEFGDFIVGRLRLRRSDLDVCGEGASRILRIEKLRDIVAL